MDNMGIGYHPQQDGIGEWEGVENEEEKEEAVTVSSDVHKVSLSFSDVLNICLFIIFIAGVVTVSVIGRDISAKMLTILIVSLAMIYFYFYFKIFG